MVVVLVLFGHTPTTTTGHTTTGLPNTLTTTDLPPTTTPTTTDLPPKNTRTTLHTTTGLPKNTRTTGLPKNTRTTLHTTTGLPKNTRTTLHTTTGLPRTTLHTTTGLPKNTRTTTTTGLPRTTLHTTTGLPKNTRTTLHTTTTGLTKNTRTTTTGLPTTLHTTTTGLPNTPAATLPFTMIVDDNSTDDNSTSKPDDNSTSKSKWIWCCLPTWQCAPFFNGTTTPPWVCGDKLGPDVFRKVTVPKYNPESEIRAPESKMRPSRIFMIISSVLLFITSSVTVWSFCQKRKRDRVIDDLESSPPEETQPMYNDTNDTRSCIELHDLSPRREIQRAKSCIELTV